jgi:hypothetical protein
MAWSAFKMNEYRWPAKIVIWSTLYGCVVIPSASMIVRFVWPSIWKT